MNLKSEKLYIDETDHVEKRAERANDAHQQALAEQGRITEQLQALETEKDSNAMASLAEQQKLYGLLLLLAAVLGFADCPIQYALNSVAFPNLWWPVLIIISVLVAAGLAVVVEVAAFAAFFDPYRPRRTVRLCLAAAGVSGALAAAAGTVMLFSRTATGDIVGFLAQVVPVSMWILGEGLPVAAGFLSAAAWTLGYPKRRDTQIDKLKQRLSALGRFIDWLERDIQKIGRAVALLVICLLTASSAFSQGAKLPPGASPAVSAAAKTPRGAPAVSASGRCLIYGDMTESVDSGFRRQAIARLAESLPHFLNAFHCSALGVGTFADEGAFAPITDIRLESAVPTDNCASATYKVEGLQKITDNLSGFKNYYQQRAVAACRAKADERAAVVRQRSREVITEVGAALNPDLPIRGRCTAINALVSHAVARATTVVLITDGVETCESTSRAIMLTEHVRLIFILLPSHGSLRDAAPSALRVGAAWQRLIPGLEIALPPEVNPRLWDEIARRRP